jgi:hypothetical protein
MVAPGQRRKGKWLGGITQIHVTRACDQACFNCTQGSNLGGKPVIMSPDQFSQALDSLKGYWGVVGMFGGNPATHPQFQELCRIMREKIPFEQRGLWCNNPMTPAKAMVMRATFNPAHSNLNVHLNRDAFKMFKDYWPESRPFGLDSDSRHSPPFVAMRDVLKKECPGCDGKGTFDGIDITMGSACEGMTKAETEQFAKDTTQKCSHCKGTGKVYDESRAYNLISNCDINQHWSAMIGVFRGQLRAWFCEIAGAQSMLHQDEPDYPDTGLDPTKRYDAFQEPRGGLLKQVLWWQLPMGSFTGQVRKHCGDCGVPLRRKGELAMAGDEGREEVSATHQDIYKPKRKGRLVELVTVDSGEHLQLMTDYVRNASGESIDDSRKRSVLK